MIGVGASVWERPEGDWSLIEGVWGSATSGMETGRLVASTARQSTHRFERETDDSVLQSLGLADSPHERESRAPPASDVSSPSPPPPGAPRIKNELYKTELCKTYTQTHGFCKYGAKCQFAHGTAELRPVRRHPRYKTRPCRNFISNGSCPYGSRCRFIHAADLHDDDLDENDVSAAYSLEYSAMPHPAQYMTPAAYALQVATQESLRLASAGMPQMLDPDLFQRQQHPLHQQQGVQNRLHEVCVSEFGLAYDSGLSSSHATMGVHANASGHLASYSASPLDSLASDFLTALAQPPQPSEIALQPTPPTVPEGQSSSQFDRYQYDSRIPRNDTMINNNPSGICTVLLPNSESRRLQAIS